MERGDDITRENYRELIAELIYECEESRGMVKNEGVISFLKVWFEESKSINTKDSGDDD